MAYAFYVNMQKRSDGKVYADLHKTDERIYFFEEEARAAIEAHPEVADLRQIVPLVALTQEEYQELVNRAEQIAQAERRRCAEIASRQSTEENEEPDKEE